MVANSSEADQSCSTVSSNKYKIIDFALHKKNEVLITISIKKKYEICVERMTLTSVINCQQIYRQLSTKEQSLLNYLAAM
ncbi:MAG TPA: hypothetical protein VJN02_01970 [Gammaproteobacteria bacterium]|nr:hypothetical protein [Gammaproteobacteria bacterium]